MKFAEPGRLLAWYMLACLLAVFTYFYGLDSRYIPRNGDEYPYAHIVRLTAASGRLLPLQSQMDGLRNTKPPLLFWQGIASTDWGKNWTLLDLRYPSVIYTLLTVALLFMLGRKLSGSLETGFIAALTFLAFFTTYRYGRPFLTNPPEVFWISLPFITLLYWRQTSASRFLIPLLFGISIGIGFLYKSFALCLPVLLGLTGWYLHLRNYRMMEFIRRDAIKVAITVSVAIALFAMWFVFDPDPQAVWKEFVVGENVGKFNPRGPGYIEKFLWGSSSLWSYTLAFLTNPGLLTFPVVVLFFVAYRGRHELSNDQKLLWIWIAAFFISFALPSQRSGRYLLDIMPALALLCALNWSRISRKAFVASLIFSGLVIAVLAYLALRLQTEIADLYAPLFWLLLTVTTLLILAAIAMPNFTRHGVNVVALLVLLCFAAFLRPFDSELGNFSAEAQRYANGKDIWVSCNFRAMDEGHRFILPGAEIHGYSDDQNLTVNELAARYPVFAVQQALNDHTENGGCAECKIIGQRLDIRGRLSNNELKAIFFEGKVLQYLFIRELLMESHVSNKAMYSQTSAQMCR